MSILKLFRSPQKTPVTIRVSVLVEPDEGSFHAFNPAFPGLHVDGRTPEDAVRNFARAVPAYLESLVRHGDPLPVGCTIEPKHPSEPEIPMGAFLRHVELKWQHSRRTSGSR